MTESGFGHWVGSRPVEIGDRGEEAASNRCSSHIDGGILKQVKWMEIHNSQCKDKDNEKSMIWMVYKSFPMQRGSLQPLFESQRGLFKTGKVDENT